MLVVGHQKGRDTKQKIYRNFGYARPEGYRKALRVDAAGARSSAARSSCFVDTPAAYPGIESEERGVAEAIALNLREMAMLEVPIIVIVRGEGGSGGALGIADRRPRADAGVRDLQRDSARRLRGDPVARRRTGRSRRPTALKITAPDLLALGIIDEIVPEPVGGAHNDSRRGRGARRSGAVAGARRAVGARRRRRGSTRATTSSGRWARKASAFIDTDRRPHEPSRRSMKPLLWKHLPCDDEAAAALGAALEPASDRGAAAVPCAASATPTTARAVPESVARPAPRSVPAGRHGPRGRRGSSRRSPARSASPSTATTTSTASPRP